MQILNDLAVNAIILFFIVMFFAGQSPHNRAIKEDYEE
jgi:hypothetical protein